MTQKGVTNNDTKTKNKPFCFFIIENKCVGLLI